MDTFAATEKPSAEPPAAVRNRTAPMPESVGAKWASLHIAGKVWTIRMGQKKQTLLNADGDPMPSIPVIIVEVARTKSKAYYADGFKPGENNPPDCASSNAALPDPASPHKQNAVCATCTKNAAGSGKTQFGKACADFRRIAVIPYKRIESGNSALGGVPVMLRVPADSLRNLQGFLDDSQANEFPFYSRVVSLKFDTTTHPKIVFHPTGFVTDEQLPIVMKHRENPITAEMLYERLKVEGDDGSEGEGEASTKTDPADSVPVTPAVTQAPKKEKPGDAVKRSIQQGKMDALKAEKAEDAARLAHIEAENAAARRAHEEATFEAGKAEGRAILEARAATEAAAAEAARAAVAPAPEVDPFEALEAMARASEAAKAAPKAEPAPAPSAPVAEPASVDEEDAGTGTDLDAMFNDLVTKKMAAAKA